MASLADFEHDRVVHFVLLDHGLEETGLHNFKILSFFFVTVEVDFLETDLTIEDHVDVFEFLSFVEDILAIFELYTLVE